MSGIDHLLALARAYSEAEGIPLKTVSWRVFEDTKKLPRLLAGSDIQSRRLEKALEWFADNWPTADWPAGVPKPSKRKLPGRDADLPKTASAHA
jgi:hypothetical protein